MEKAIMFILGYFLLGSVIFSVFLVLSLMMNSYLEFTTNHGGYFFALIPFGLIGGFLLVSEIQKNK